MSHDSVMKKPIIYKRIRLLTSATRIGILLLVLGGCFPVGLPEHFSDLGQVGSVVKNELPQSASGKLVGVKRPGITALKLPAVIIVPDEFNYLPAGKSREYIGKQFVLIAFPLTRLYFEHSLDNLLLETSLDVFIQKGYQPFVVRKKDAASLLARLPPLNALELETNDLGINVYDAFFFRVVSLSGTLSGNVFGLSDSANLRLLNKFELEMGESKIKRYGHGPFLAYFIRRKIERAIEEGLEKAPLVRRRRLFPTNPKLETVTAIAPPKLTTALPARMGELMSSSYGFKTSQALGPSAISRVMQRGAAQSFADLNLPHFVLAEEAGLGFFRRGANKKVWSLEFKVDEVQIHEGDDSSLEMAATLTMKAVKRRSSKGIFQARCVIREPLEMELDGYWVVTLEKASQKLVSAFLENETS
ncbi:hypothetical protein BVY02_01335, partial [bacterium J17]